MIYIYTAILVISAGLLAADFTLRQLEGIKNFGLLDNDKDFPLLRDFRGQTHTIPVERLCPETPAMLITAATVFGAAGVFFDLMNMTWHVSIPCAFCAGLGACFLRQYVLVNLIDRLRKITPPVGEEMAGVEGYVTSAFPPDDYGEIAFEWKGREFRANALAVNGQHLPEYERVLLLYESDGFYFVEHITEQFTIDN